MGKKDAVVVREILKKATGKDLHEKELTVRVYGRSMIHLTLRQDNRDKKVWYLNMDGNPLTFLTGTNVYGWPEADKQIVKVFLMCLDSVEKKTKMEFPKRIREQIQGQNIRMNMLEFASYTPPLLDKKRIVNAWGYMFRRSNSLKMTGGYYKSLEELLNVRVYEQSWKNTSFSLAVLNSQRSKEVLFMAYDKEEQMREQRREQEEKDDVEFDVKARGWKKADQYSTEGVPIDIKKRLRLEISLQSVWFNRRRIKTLLDLKQYVARHHGGDWAALIASEIQRVLDRACLVEMWSFDKQAVLDAADLDLPVVPGLNAEIPTDAWLAMLEARSEYGMDRKLVLAKLSRNPERRAEYLSFLDREVDSITDEEIALLRMTTNLKVAHDD